MRKVPKWPNYLDRHSTLMYIVPMDESTTPNKISSDLLRGHTDTIILKLLLSGDKYGYEISKLIHVNSSGEYELKEATMYSSLKRLEGDGCIISYWGDETQGGRRRYYQITERGKRVHSENKNNWEYAKRVLDNLL